MAAREAVVQAHMPQVRAMVRQIRASLPFHVPAEDLVQEGVIGLLDALRKFDSRKKVPLRLYTKFRVRGAILDSLRALDWSPRQLRREARRVETVSAHLSGQLGRAPSEEETAATMGFSLRRLQRLRLELHRAAMESLEGNTSSARASLARQRHEAATPEPDPLAVCRVAEMKRLLARHVARLPEKERIVLSLYYHEGLTMKEAAKVMGYAASRISQLHAQALLRLRSQMCAPCAAPMESRRPWLAPFYATASSSPFPTTAEAAYSMCRTRLEFSACDFEDA